MKKEGPLKVALVLRHFYPVVTGPAVRHRQIAELIHEMGIRMEFHTVLPSGSNLPHIENNETHDVIRHDLSAKKTIKEQLWDAALFDAARSYWADTNSKPQVIVLFSTSRMLLPNILWAKRNRIKLALSLTIAPEIHQTTKLKGFLTRLALSLALKSFDALCALSETLGKQYVKLGAINSRIHVFPFPVNTQRFRPPASIEEKMETRERLGLPKDKKLVLFSGGIIKRKGVDLLLNAWSQVVKRHPNAVLVLLGEKIRKSTATSHVEAVAEDTFHTKLLSIIEKSQIAESIVFVGQVLNPQDYCMASDLFVFPSRLEGMGGVVPEAMASGLPCVITPFVGFPKKEFGTEGIHYLLSELHSDTIAESICRLLDDPELSLILGNSARQWALNQFDLGKITQGMAQLYRSMTA